MIRSDCLTQMVQVAERDGPRVVPKDVESKGMVTVKSIAFTILAIAWRSAVAVADWRTLLRKLSGKPLIDVLFISNLRDETDRNNYLGLLNPKEGHFDGNHYWFNRRVACRIRVINTTANDLAAPSGWRRAKEQFVAAVKWGQERGVKVVLLAAGTKRLFGRNGEELKKLFPEILFTIGDNGTANILLQEIEEMLRRTKLNPKESRIVVLGATGILGSQAMDFLMGREFKVVAVSSDALRLARLSLKFGSLETQFAEKQADLAKIGQVDAVVACTHNPEHCLISEIVSQLRKPGRKLAVVDVSVPSNLTESEYEKCRDWVIRQDAGNAYSRKIHYVLSSISCRMLRMERGTVFGCFAEAILLGNLILKGENWIREINWFDISRENIEKAAEMFLEEGFAPPSPKCFRQPIISFLL